MPFYCCVCDTCGYEGEIQKRMSEPFPNTCPSCKRKRLRQDYSRHNYTVDDGVIRSVGRQAEKNLKEMGKEMEQKEAEKILGPKGIAKKNASTPWWRKKGSKPLDVSKVKDIKRYIETGEK